MENKPIILFDLDGTLIDSTDAILHCFFKSFEKFGYKKPKAEDITKLIGYPLEYMYAHLGVEEKRVDEFVLAYKECYRKISRQMTTLLPQAKEAIELASTFARLGVVTTKTARYSYELLEYMDVMKYFEVLVGRENVTNPKPHPEPIFLALEQMCVKTKQNIYIIGDTWMDIECGKSADIEPIAVLSGYGDKKELQKYTSNIFNNAHEAVKMIRKSDN